MDRYLNEERCGISKKKQTVEGHATQRRVKIRGEAICI